MIPSLSISICVFDAPRPKEKIRKACGLPDAQVEFITGGTQTNQIVISTMLNDWEGVLAADT